MICSCGGITRRLRYRPNINDFRVDCKDACIVQVRTDKKADLLIKLGRKNDAALLNKPYDRCTSCGRVAA